MHRVSAADGTGIAFEVAGSGPPLVLLHGITEDHRLWAPIVERLADGFTCVAMDARGHGQSDPSRSGYDPFTMAADAAAVVDAVGPGEAPVLVGHSLGGLMATVYAAAGAGPVRAVLNIDQTLRMTDFAAAVRPLEPELRGPGFAQVMGSFADVLGVGSLPADAADRVRAYDRAGHPEVVLGIWGPLFDTPDEELAALVETDLLPNVRVPYLALHGADPGPGYVEWLTSRVATATVEVWDGHGHWLHLVDPDRFVARVRDFVAAT